MSKAEILPPPRLIRCNARKVARYAVAPTPLAKAEKYADRTASMRMRRQRPTDQSVRSTRRQPAPKKHTRTVKTRALEKKGRFAGGLLPSGQAMAETLVLRARRNAAKARPPKPASIITQVEASGTALLTLTNRY